MFEITRIKTTIKPEKVESLGNGIWYYNYDIKESIEPGQEGQDETVYDFVQVRISGTPDYDKCTKAIIRAYVNSDSEFDLMNSFNAYQLGITDSAGEDYEKYLQLLQEIKEKVGKDFNKQADTAKSHTPRQADITKLMPTYINVNRGGIPAVRSIAVNVTTSEVQYDFNNHRNIGTPFRGLIIVNLAQALPSGATATLPIVFTSEGSNPTPLTGYNGAAITVADLKGTGIYLVWHESQTNTLQLVTGI